MILIRLTKKLNTLFGPIDVGAQLLVRDNYALKLVDAGWAEFVEAEPESAPDEEVRLASEPEVRLDYEPEE